MLLLLHTNQVLQAALSDNGDITFPMGENGIFDPPYNETVEQIVIHFVRIDDVNERNVFQIW